MFAEFQTEYVRTHWLDVTNCNRNALKKISRNSTQILSVRKILLGNFLVYCKWAM